MVLLEGFVIGIGLIVAIGAQGAFVLRQGLLRQYVFMVATICVFCDVALIFAGAMGIAPWIASNGDLLRIATIGGAGFLLFYGAICCRSALTAKALQLGHSPRSRRSFVALNTLALTLLNPHVYLDNVLVLGSLAATYTEALRLTFVIGTLGASVIWFYGLGYGATALGPLFEKPLAIRTLNVVLMLLMWTIAMSLLMRSFESGAEHVTF
jgi:L-lysine exporter family protein LysE/ArgO